MDYTLFHNHEQRKKKPWIQKILEQNIISSPDIRFLDFLCTNFFLTKRLSWRKKAVTST